MVGVDHDNKGAQMLGSHDLFEAYGKNSRN